MSQISGLVRGVRGQARRALRQGQGRKHHLEILKGQPNDLLFARVAEVVNSKEAKAVARRAEVDMRELVQRLADQPTDPTPLPTTLYATEGEAVKGCATPPFGGQLLYGIIRVLAPNRVLEIGSGHGYGAFYIGSALKANGGGSLVTLEGMNVRVELATETIRRLGLGGVVSVQPGDFRATVPASLNEPPDLVFSDGDKSLELTKQQFELCMEAMPSGHLFFDDINFSDEITGLWHEFVANPRIERAVAFDGRWGLLDLAVR